jgi:PmbA protein
MKTLAESTVGDALTAGADTVEASIIEEMEFAVTVRNGRIENLVESSSRRIAVTVSIDKGKAHVTSTDLSAGSIDQLIKGSIELSRVMDRDEYAGLPEKELLGSAGEDLGIYDEETARAETKSKIELALSLEKDACAIDDRIISDGASCSTSVITRTFANSLGFCEAYNRTSCSIDISCAVEDRPASGLNTGKKQSSWWYSASVSLSGLDAPGRVAEKAVGRTLRKIGAVKPETCEVPVIFDPVTAGGFLSSIASAAGGGSIYRKSSFLVDMLGQRIGSPLVTVVDDPLMREGLGTRPFDGEGVRPMRKIIVDSGVLDKYLLSSYHSRKLSLEPPGNAGGPSNFFMEAGETAPEDIISSVDNGLYLTSLAGPGANWTTGDFSQGGQGIWIRGGELAEPVGEFTIAGTFARMLSDIEMVGSDLEWRSAVNAPTFKIGSMTISGK